MKERLTITRNGVLLLLAQAAVWAIILLLPALTVLLFTSSYDKAAFSIGLIFHLLWAPCLLYFLNFYVFWRWFFSRRHYVWFAVANLLLLVVLNYRFFFISRYVAEAHIEMPSEGWLGMAAGFFLYFLFNCVVIAAAIALRHFIRTRRLKAELLEQKKKHTEAELAWLKNQINPHFLFNTLNNISCLVEIDGEAAQESLAKLSDLLRYAMYETDKALVPLGGEVAFMQNYIDLMRLRHNEQLAVSCSFDVADAGLCVPPLLFVSLIENAFKHGVSSSRRSQIDVSLRAGEGITFVCSNTNYPKDDRNRSGSGIGLENTRRRLELQYAGRYTWEQAVSDDNIYTIRITLSV